MLFALLLALITPAQSSFEIGSGIYDVTGPAADINFMGYAIMSQVGAGVHFRPRARAYAMYDNSTKLRFAFVSADIGMGSDAVNVEVLKALDKDPITKGLYNHTTICISGTHTHSAPAGFLTHTIFQVSSLGFCRQTFDAYVTGIAQAIIAATKNLQPGRMLINEGIVDDANINRSPTAYLRNPAEERSKYENNTDHDMVLIKAVNAETGAPIGSLNWYSVHGTSMNNTNKLISGDNKGYAAYLFEKALNPAGTLPGTGSFVAAFASTNLGDVSPNTNGTYCMDTGLPCNTVHSTCNNRTEMCVGRGPGADMFESTRIIGERQYDVARSLFDNANRELDGPVDSRMSYVDMAATVVTLDNGTKVTTCTPAFGYSFAAGTTDGPGMFNFVQSTTSGNPFWNTISGFLSKPTKAQIACHHPKPILLNVANISFPYPWADTVLPIQVLRFGPLFIVALPSELTTMAGRRLRAAVKAEIVRLKLESNPVVTIAGLANDYADYCTTYEEYQEQRYEGASTVYGPHQLSAYIQEVKRLVNDLAKGTPSDTLPPPDTHLSEQKSFRPGVIMDYCPFGHEYGDVSVQPSASYKRGEVVSVKFYSANPRNNLRTQGTFLTVEMQQPDKSWKVVKTDGDWDTKFEWARPSKVTAESYATIKWDIPADAAAGTYRIRHFNAHKEITQKIYEFSGTSNSFSVA